MRVNDKYSLEEVQAIKDSVSHIPEIFIERKLMEQRMMDSDYGNAVTIRERDWKQQADWLIQQWSNELMVARNIGIAYRERQQLN
jgi:hypothetical protein